MRPRVKPALRRILRDEQTLQYGVHPLRAVLLSGLARPVRQWLECLDGTRDLDRVLDAANAAGLDECRARALLDQLTAQGALHDAATGPEALRDLTLAERDRLRPDLDALDLSCTSPDGGMALLTRRRAARVRVYGAGRVGAQIVALLAAAGVGHIRVIDPGTVRAGHITPGGLSWAEVGMTREEGAAAVARRLTSGGHPPTTPSAAGSAPQQQPGDQPRLSTRQPASTQRPAGSQQPADPQRPITRHHRGSAPQPGTPTWQPSSSGTDMRYLGRPPSQRAAELAARQEAMAPPRKRRDGRYVDGQDLVRPTVEVLAGGTYLGDQSDRPDLVVIAPVTPLDGVLANELIALGIPHLLAAAFEGHGTVGPLVLPGRTACLHCLDLARRDRDPGWPIVTAKVGGYPPGEIACDATLATLVAAEATGHALAHLDGRESAVTNGTMDVTPDWRWKRSSWQRHPQCRCMRNDPYSLRMVMSPHRD
ncbi:ThiF family adenylyltransferase [Actinomadura sp. ATCC 31491]|uniref:ThiF family adenylyltransferase n=1 Tax=Actinomadura luzonensis TaxID=2805427 RepID=A0ABT0FL60_9ACTN|nr:ThiF family adenylyltransferase [Actinomadura luzonensis]MCK2212984.1 ThiF family adenylyltransferase [Actinomadura luzonensis]